MQKAEMIQKLQQAFAKAQFRARVRFTFETGLQLTVANRNGGIAVVEDDTGSVSAELLLDYATAVLLVEKRLPYARALITDRLRVKGDMAVAWGVAMIFGARMPRTFIDLERRGAERRAKAAAALAAAQPQR